MAALTAGVQYSLSSNQNNGLMPKQRTSKNKTLFFVKLTDSCLKAVEDYLKCCQQVSKIPFPRTYDPLLFSLVFEFVFRGLSWFVCCLRDFSIVYSSYLATRFCLWPRPQFIHIFRFD